MGPVYCLPCLPDDATFGQRLRAYRVAARLTHAELALRIGVPTATIWCWEQGRLPTPANVAKLIRVLSVGCRTPSMTRGGWSVRKSVIVSCRECGREIAKFGAEPPSNRPVWCLECLAKHPEATFGERLKSHRLAAGITQRELAESVCLRSPSIAHYEADKGLPKPGNLVKLTHTLGAGFAASNRQLSVGH
jgi:transcriptional regulator with XRE-family HTH domain